MIASRFVRLEIVAAAVLAAAFPSFAEPLPDGVADCLERIERQSARAPAPEAAAADPGPQRLGGVCPELAAALDEGAWGASLVDANAGELGTDAFEELVRVAASYEQPQPTRDGISASSLDEVLAALELREPEVQASLWERMQKWLDERFGARDDRAGRWIEDWLGNLSIPERLVRYVLLVLGVVLVVATAAVVVNELRIAGVLAGGALRKYTPHAARGAQDETKARDFDDIARAPLARRPALLLLLLVERLRSRATASLRDSLTHRELVAAAGDLSADQSESLRAVANAAERATFGGWRPEERDVDELIARSRRLAASLSAERAAPP